MKKTRMMMFSLVLFGLLALAWESKDSSVIADTYQDLSLFNINII